MVIIPRILVISHKKRLYDVPDSRKVHTTPVPRLGGLSFFPVVLMSFALVIGFRLYLWPSDLSSFSIEMLHEYLFLWEITKILGMITMPKDTEIRYPDSNNNNRICTSLIRSHLMKATPSPRRHATLGSPHGRVGMLLIICNLCRLFARCACGHTSGANDP